MIDVGHSEPHDRLATLGAEPLELLGAELAAVAVVPHDLGAALEPARRHLVVGAVAVVGELRVGQLVEHLAVEVATLGLPVGAVRSADQRALVPVEPQPLHRADHRVERLLGAALLVGVLDAEDEGATMVAREGPVVERRASEADVRGAGRGRAETDANGHNTSFFRTS